MLGQPAHKRNMGMVFQSYSLFPNLDRQPATWRSGCGSAGSAAPSGTGASARRSSGCTSARSADRYPHQLSGGQQQRVALARALVFEPAVLLLDEPLSALDAKVRVGLREEIRRLQLQLGMTTLFVTHDQEEALSISDRVGVMSNGRIEQLGTPREVYGEPATGVRRPLRRADQRAPRRGDGEGVEVAGVRVGVSAAGRRWRRAPPWS